MLGFGGEKNPEMTDEHAQVMKEILDDVLSKYDGDKNGKFHKEEMQRTFTHPSEL
jgi:hypothetical protein